MGQHRGASPRPDLLLLAGQGGALQPPGLDGRAEVGELLRELATNVA